MSKAAWKEDVSGIVADTMSALIGCADRHGVNRDELAAYFLNVWHAFKKTITLEEYKDTPLEGQITFEEVGNG